MRSFHDLFPAIAEKEHLTVQVTDEALPNGIYTFLEYFCDNLSCRCTTVALEVVFFDSIDHSINKSIASIDYAWDKPISRKNPVFHEESTQSDMAQAALTIFRRILEDDSSYAKNINDHFEMIRAYVRTEKKKTPDIQSNPSKCGRNDPCLCGSGKKHKKCCLRK
jgi:hypothetical protein